MKRTVRMTALLCAFVILLSTMTVFTSFAVDTDSSEVRYTQKIVSVVYDNSGSMSYGNRGELATYSMRMLMAMFDERDTLVITPMNDLNGNVITVPGYGVEVNLAAPDREAEINRVVNTSGIFTENGGTPSEPIGLAVSELINRGLKDADHLYEAEDNKEYWLIVMTDGDIDGGAEPSISAAVSDYPSLNTIFLSLDNPTVNLKGSDLDNSGLHFDAYNADQDTLVSVMQEISNKMSGRYTLKKDADYTVNGNRVTINLDNLGFALSSVSVIAQNCGATMTSAIYQDQSVTITNGCVIEPKGIDGLKSAHSALLDGNDYFYEGTIELTYSGNVDANMLSIFAEPALRIVPYMEYQDGSDWIRVDIQYINENLTPGDQIRVGYEVYEQASGDPIDLTSIFGKAEESVTYGGNVYKIGDKIPLVAGTHEIRIAVSVMDGAYSLVSSEFCTVEQNPSYYRVECDHNETVTSSGFSGDVTYTVFIDNHPATVADLATYTYSATMFTPDGREINIPVTVQSDGKIVASISENSGAFGKYNISFSITSEYRTTRSAEYTVTVAPASMTVGVSGSDHLSITQYDLKHNTEPFIFDLSAEGKPFPFDSGLVTYKLTVGGIDVTEYTTVNEGALTYIPTEDSLLSIINSVGDHDVVLTVEYPEMTSLNTSTTAKLTIIKTAYTVEAVTYGSRSIDRFNIGKTQAALYFKVLRDGRVFTLEELQDSYDKGMIGINLPGAFTFGLIPVGVEISVEELNGEAVIAIRAVKDMKDLPAWFTSMLLFGSEKGVTVSYSDVDTTADFVITNSSLFEYLIRILVILLMIGFIIYIIIYIIGFRKTALLPNGTFVIIKDDGMGSCRVNTVEINNSWLRVIGWHLTRLLIWKIWSVQPLKKKRGNEARSFSAHKIQHCKSQNGNIDFGLRVTKVNACWALNLNAAQKKSIDSIINDVSKGIRLTKSTTKLPEIKKVFMKKNNVINKDSNCNCIGDWYGGFAKNLDDRVVLQYAITFVRRKRRFR